MSPKYRTKDRHLPPNVYFKHGAYYWAKPLPNNKRKWIRLGKTLHEALAVYATLIDSPTRITLMDNLFDRYMIEVAPFKSINTFKSNIRQIKLLRSTFGLMRPEDVASPHIYKYLDYRKKIDKAPIGANREKALLSHIFTKAIQWGIIKNNPCKDVMRNTEKPRDRYIENWEYKAVWELGSKLIKCMMDLAYLTGQRKGDLLQIKLGDIRNDGIYIQQSKTGKKLLIEWSDELRSCIDRAKKIFTTIRSIYLFCNRKGAPYTPDGFSSIWQRLMNKALKDEVIAERFTFHDIRAKSSTDIKDRGHASDLLGHSDPRVTERHYNRKIKKVSPVR